MKKLAKLVKSLKSFTLIELLIVIGILAVLVVTILVTLNPSEAQKKARDAKRMKDLSTYVALMEQYINDGNPPICTAAGAPGTGGCNTLAAGQGKSQPATTSDWLATDMTKYTNSLPLDPSNSSTRTYVSGGTVASPTVTTGLMYYVLRMSGSDYEIQVRQESKANANNVLNDGGNEVDWAEAGSNLTLF